MIERYQLRYFLAIIDEGTFSKASAACNVAQPTLSVGIAKLEQFLGHPLFHRTNKRVELTEAGARFAPYARQIAANFVLAEQEIRGSSEPSLLRIGILGSIPSEWSESFIERLGRMSALHRVELVEARESELTDRLARGRIDLALTILGNVGSRFASEPLFVEGYSLAMAAGHRFAHRDLIRAEELADSPMIVRRHCEILSETSRFFTTRGIRPAFPGRTTSDDRALRYVRAGLGITIMPDCFSAWGVVRPRLADFTFERQVGLLYSDRVDPRRLRDQPQLQALIATVEERRPAGAKQAA